ncbi:hypothetical protein A3Q56_04968 [Intoshia linei]|uniref:Kinesin motor domain-containing protein n=1 Tax=Intoshia linei TaxID=1819745 RepID=A0A177B0X8_9BILA|nr:hypothetical protein A3Q56_04968 [Intoshia linei]
MNGKINGNEPDRVKVIVRIRPQNDREKLTFSQICVTHHYDNNQVVIGNDRCFTFDKVFGPNATQDSIYHSICEPLIDSCLKGYNATIFAYGQTGSGKTYSMGTCFDICSSPEEEGIIPRAVSYLFEKIDIMKKPDKDNISYIITVNTEFIEIYNEQIIDLLDDTKLENETKRRTHRIHQDANGNIYTVGISRKLVNRALDTMNVLKIGALIRTTASTNMNKSSSRSHAIFTIHLKIVQSCESTIKATYTSKFNFVDLAGSERLKRTGAIGDRRKEGISINLGLLALGNVISALGDETKLGSHVPYRDSKLTRLLQDSLGGNSKTLMISCISPSDIDLTETLNTLKYANRAKNIKNTISVNQDASSKTIEDLQCKIIELQHKLDNPELCSSCGGSFSNPNVDFNEKNKQINVLNVEIKDCYSKIKYFNSIFNSLPPNVLETLNSNFIDGKDKNVAVKRKKSKYDREIKSDTECESNISPKVINKSPRFKTSTQSLTSNKSDSDYSIEIDVEPDMPHNLQDNLDTLSKDILFKEKLINQLEESESKLKSLRTYYEEKIESIKNKMQEAEIERNQIIQKMGKTDKNSNDAARFKIMETDYNEKINLMKNQIKILQTKKRTGSSDEQSTIKIKLQREVTNLKTEKVNLLKKIRKEAAKRRSIEKLHTRMQARFVKNTRMKENKIKALTNICDRKDYFLKRKQMEIENIRKRSRIRNIIPTKVIQSVDVIIQNIDKLSLLIAKKKVRYNELEKDMNLWCTERNTLVSRLSDIHNKKLQDKTESDLVSESIKPTLEFTQEKIKYYSNSILQQERCIKNCEAQLASVICNIKKCNYTPCLEKIIQNSIKASVVQTISNMTINKMSQKLHHHKKRHELQRHDLMYLTRNMSSDDKVQFNQTFIDDENCSSSESDDSVNSVAETIIISRNNDQCLPREANLPEVDTLFTKYDKNRANTRKTFVNLKIETTDIKDAENLKEYFVEPEKMQMKLNSTFSLNSCEKSIENTNIIDKSIIITELNEHDINALDDTSIFEHKMADKVKNEDIREERSQSDERSCNRNIDVFSRLTATTVSNVPNSQGKISTLSQQSKPTSVLREIHQAFGHSKPVSDVCATLSKMFTASKDRSAKMWDLTTGNEISSYSHHLNNVSLVRFIEPMNLLISASSYKMNLWDIRANDAKPVQILLSSGMQQDPLNLKIDCENRQLSNCPPKECHINDVSIDSSYRWIFSTAGLIIRHWDMRSLKVIGKLYGGYKGLVTALTTSQNVHTKETIVASGSKDHHLRIFKLNANFEHNTGILMAEGSLYPPHYDGIESLLINEDKLYSCSRDKGLREWSLNTGYNLLQSKQRCHDDWICGLGFLKNINLNISDDYIANDILLSVCRGGYINMWNTDVINKIESVHAHDSAINSIATNSENFIFTASEYIFIF